MPLTPRERIFKTLAFEEVDIVPYHIMIDEMVRPQLAEYLSDPEFERKIENHLPFYNLEPKITWLDDHVYCDSFGCVWRKANIPHLEQNPLQLPSLEDYNFPDLTEPDYFEEAGGFFATYDQHFTLCGIAHGYFDRGWSLRGMENFLSDFLVNPIFVEEFFDKMTDLYLELIDVISKYPFDGIRFGDDWGYQRGVLIGASRWRKFIKPGLKKIFERAREKSLTVMVHSDGDVSELIPDLIEIGVSILNPVQPEVMDILKIKRLYGKDLCLNGGMSTQFTLPRGSAQDVRKEAAACFQYLGKDGGYVFSPAKAILPDVPLENASALIDAVLNQPVNLDRGSEPIPQRVEELWKVYSEFHPQSDPRVPVEKRYWQ
ncbi:MAG: hypothetical protein EHM41_22530 [Chloroflexi bacterium]|nr:MAG: hypothetical protein EHM41_22530 [Chloroflexota bacterium]